MGKNAPPPREKVEAMVRAYHANGQSVTAAARAVGVARQTAGEWLIRAPAWYGIDVSPPAVEKPRFRVPALSRYASAAHVEVIREEVPPPPPVDRDQPVKVLVFGDAHDDPALPKDRFRWAGRLVADLQPDRVVWIGDIADLDSLNGHTPNETLDGKLKPSFIADMASLNEALEAYAEGLGGHVVETDMTGGNHDIARILRAEQFAPHVAGMMQAEFYGVMDAHGIRVHDFGAYLDIGGVLFTHIPLNIMGRPMGGMQATATVGRQSTQDVIFGHTHRASVHMAPKVNGDAVRVFEVGCFLPDGYKAKTYAKHSLGGWSYGACELLIHRGNVRGWSFIPMSEIERRYG